MIWAAYFIFGILYLQIGLQALMLISFIIGFIKMRAPHVFYGFINPLIFIFGLSLFFLTIYFYSWITVVENTDCAGYLLQYYHEDFYILDLFASGFLFFSLIAFAVNFFLYNILKKIEKKRTIKTFKEGNPPSKAQN